MFKHILLATNGSESAQKAEDHALYLTRISGVALTVVHVIDDSLCHYGHVDQLVSGESKDSFVAYVISEAEAASREIINEFSRKAASLDVEYSLISRHGEVAVEIAAAAKQAQADLIIMGGQHPVRGKRVRFATLADNVTAQTACNTMILR
ncbi:MAG: universal stress protein [Desulfocapsa sp.]|nr:universal stress protein [Desulfocapsa sp.]